MTLAKEGNCEIYIQKSRFIGHACPCETEQDALSFLQKIRLKYKDATHHCYAYIIGKNEGIMRYSDDGEPGGTAGLPIIGTIRSRHVVNCCVVVVRYFGGVLLGTGGLVRAYTQSCKEVLDASGIVQMSWSFRDLCEVPYSCWDTICHAAERLPILLEDVDFGPAVSFHLISQEKDRPTILETFEKITSRQFEWIAENEAYAAWPSDSKTCNETKKR